MDKISSYELEDIVVDDIASDELKKVIRKYVDNSRLWKISLFAFLIALAADYLLGSFLGKDTEGGFNYTRLGTFLVILISLLFIVFVVGLIRDSRILNKKWVCPNCKEKLPYYVSKTGGNGRYGNKEILDKTYRSGMDVGRIKDIPMLVPDHCPRCKTQFLDRSRKS